MEKKTLPKFGYATDEDDAIELLYQKIAVHESVVTAVVYVLDAAVGSDNCLIEGLQYSFAELRDVALHALEEEARMPLANSMVAGGADAVANAVEAVR